MFLRRWRQRIALLAFASVVLLPARDASAHAKLRASIPAANAQLDESPSEIRLSFTEAIEPALSSITVRDRATNGSGMIRAHSVPGDARTCVAPLEPLRPGAYVVEWRTVSADGHAMTGSYTFTIRSRAMPAAAAPQPPAAPPAPAPAPMRASRREMGARWLFITGVAGVFGATAAALARFGGEAELPLAAGAWIVACLGLVLFGDAQLHTAETTAGELMRTSIGRALLWRAAALAVAGIALLVARSSAARRVAMLTVFVSALVAMAVHVAAGHAAGVERFPAAAIGLQWVHFAAAGVWLGGLAALVSGTRGVPDAAKTAAIRRYSTLAGIALATVAATGILRTAQGLSSWNQLVATDYGKTALAKVALLLAIATLGAVNRWRSVPAASTNLRPLRRFALIELALMTVVLGVAAILATLPPPS